MSGSGRCNKRRPMTGRSNIAKSMSFQSRILREGYTGQLSLKTTDHARTTSLLAKFFPSTARVCQNGSKLDHGLFLCELGNVLSPQECEEIVRNADECIFECMSDKYRFGKQRSSSRLLALDKSLAENLWENIEPVLAKEIEDLGISKRPLGFDVSRGEWELHDLNEAMRISKYSGEKEEFFSPHKDAQYCPSGDERSLLTLLVYLNEDFQGGETCFYFPKDITKSAKGMTTREEIESVGGLTKGYNCMKIVPRISHAVLFSQNILHESLPVVSGTKYILKTDVVVKRHSKQFGFAVEEREKEDYLTCLNYFREAQQQELKENFDRASDLYEKALSIRYCYPSCLEKVPSDPPLRENKIPSGWKSLPLEVWQNIFKYLPGYDAQNLVYAYPWLNLAKKCWERHERNNVGSLSGQEFLPKVNYQKGILTRFEFPDAEFFRENASACCRVAAVYSFFLLGHKADDNVYTVRYNPDTQDVCAVALETLLTDVFYSRRCYGSFYNVRQQDAQKKHPRKDFEASVDRTYMLIRHGAEFVGVDLSERFCVRSTAYVEPEYEFYEDILMAEERRGRTENKENEDQEKRRDKTGEGENEDEDDDDDDDDDDDIDDEADDDDIDDEDDQDEDDEDLRRKRKAEVNKTKGVKRKAEKASGRALKICDGSLPVIYDTELVNGDHYCDVNSIMRSFIEAHESTKSHPFNYLGSFLELDEEELGCVPFDDVNSDRAYLWKLLEKAVAPENVSCTLVSKLRNPLRIKHNAICLCHHYLGKDKLRKKVANGCTTECYNHLVFDFQKAQLSVKFCGSNRDGQSVVSLLDDNQLESIAKEQKSVGCVGEEVFYEVNIEPILSSETSFNHASCNCMSPRFEVHEFCNIKHYPYLNRIFLATRELDGRMLVWSVYCGIVAL